jgi:hypothetical protein
MTDPAYGLLRPRGDRPNDRRAAEKRDEFSSLHVTHQDSLCAIPKDYHFATGRRVRNGTKSALLGGQAEVRNGSNSEVTAL